MAASIAINRPPTAIEIAGATAVAIPSEISTRPLLGILGVLIGAGLVTLTGRMLSLGLADLRGHVGISIDQGAWLDSAYNAAVMFIGPFLSLIDGFLLVAWTCAVALLLVALLRKSPLNYHELSTLQNIPAATKESKR